MGAVTRRGFLKRLGVALVGAPFAGPVLKQAWDAIPVERIPVASKWKFTDADNLTARKWANAWWKEAQEESYFHKIYGPPVKFDGKNNRVIAIETYRGVS